MKRKKEKDEVGRDERKVWDEGGGAGRMEGKSGERDEGGGTEGGDKGGAEKGKEEEGKGDDRKGRKVWMGEKVCGRKAGRQRRGKSEVEEVVWEVYGMAKGAGGSTEGRQMRYEKDDIKVKEVHDGRRDGNETRKDRGEELQMLDGKGMDGRKGQGGDRKREGDGDGGGISGREGGEDGKQKG